MSAQFYSMKGVDAVAEVRDGVPGMAILYTDGYRSWCPLDVFERDYQSCDKMSFWAALFAMSKGEKVRRAGWNGKGMWICKGEGVPALAAEAFWNKHSREFAEVKGGRVDVLPYIIMKTADDKILMGWLASQTDMLADDWQVA